MLFHKSHQKILISALVMVLFIAGCANFRAYFNAYFNAQKAFHKAGKLKKARLKKNPLDSVDVAPPEKKQYERAIAKASKVLELYSEEPNDYLPKSLFIIGESYLLLKEYGRALVKYEEIEKAYPNFEKMPLVKFHKAKCVFLSANYPEAKQALIEFIAQTKNPKFKLEAMNDLAKLEKENDSPEASLAAYVSLLNEKALKPDFKAIILFEAAKLAFDLSRWDECRKYTGAPEVKLLPLKIQFECKLLSSKSLYNSGNKKGGIDELELILNNKKYTSFFPEAQLFLAKWYFENDNDPDAINLLESVTVLAPKTEYAAEAFYLLGDHSLAMNNEKKALDQYDSSAACGDSLEFAVLAKERVAALNELFKLRGKSYENNTLKDISNEFYLAELFLFRLDNPDSAVSHMNNIVADTSTDSIFTIKAAYARAYVTDEFTESKNSADSLYKYVLEKYPGTEYAKQAEYNLGLAPSVKTHEDLAHKLFLEAEELNYSGYDLKEKVLPAFQKVVDEYPATYAAAKAQFVLAMLLERDALMGDEYSLYLAKLAHAKVRQNYKDSEFYPRSNNKLLEAGIQPGDSIKYIPVADSGGAATSDVDTVTNVAPAVEPDTAKTSDKNLYEDEYFDVEDVDSKETLDVGEGEEEDEYY